MNTFQLECFIAVADTLSFARAAERMNVSQPTITHQIKSLENELNVTLFRRSTRIVEITNEGREFITDAHSMLAISKRAKLRFNTDKEKPIEIISIGCGNYIQLAMLSNTLNRLRSAIPNLHPRLFVSPPEQLFQFLENEQLDLLFGVYDQTTMKKRFKYRELLQSDMICVCHREHMLAKLESMTIEDLKSETLIFCNPMSLAPEMAKLQSQLAEGRTPDEMHFCSSSAASYVLARSGFGIAILPDMLIPDDPEIVRIRLCNAPKLSFGLFYKPSAGDELTRRFISIAREQFKRYADTESL